MEQYHKACDALEDPEIRKQFESEQHPRRAGEHKKLIAALERLSKAAEKSTSTCERLRVLIRQDNPAPAELVCVSKETAREVASDRLESTVGKSKPLDNRFHAMSSRRAAKGRNMPMQIGRGRGR